MLIYPPFGAPHTDLPDQQAAYRVGGDPAEALSAIIEIAVANTAYSSGALTPGAYEFWMSNGSALDALVYLGGASGTPTVPTPSVPGVAALQVPADALGKFRATAALPYFWVKLVGSATGTLRLSRVSD